MEDDGNRVFILVVDDEPDLELLIRQRFRRKIRDGLYEFSFAANGKEALDIVDSGAKIDVILSDINMPVMDGFDATIGIKKIADTPVIALTAAAKLEIMERIDACGFDGFVAKPIDAAELLKKIREVIALKNHKA